jgi:hypothetical protein
MKKIGIAYVYCSYKEQEYQTATNLVTSILQQLVQRDPVIPEEIVSLYDHHVRKRTRPTLVEWSKLLKSEVRRFPKVFVVIDALDECYEKNGTRSNFLKEIRRLHPFIRLLVTSRLSPAIESEFFEAARLEIRASDTDVRKYLEHRLANLSQLGRHAKKDPTLKETIANALVKNAKGM